jgi:FkbM family methyltransferase
MSTVIPPSPIDRPLGASIHTLIPENDPIELIAYYPEFADYYPACELQTKRWFVENVGRDWIIFDIGANIGYYSILFARLAPKGSVYAFEPTSTIDLLRKNLAWHRVENVKTHEVALGAASGHIEEYLSHLGQPAERMHYEFATVDDMMARLDLQRLDCVKIDVDSFDFEVLQGAERTLERLNPWIIVELNRALAKRNHSVAEALEWLAARGYSSAHVLDYENYVLRRPVSEASPPLAKIPELHLSFEQRPVVLRKASDKGAAIADYFGAKPVLHGSASIATDSRDAGVITVPGPRWNYAASWRRSASRSLQGPLMIEVEITSIGGEVGLGCVTPAMVAYVGNEVIVSPAAARQNATLEVPDGDAVGHLVLRNADPDGHKALANVHRINVFRRVPASARSGASVLAKDKRRLSLAECEAALSYIEPSPNSGAGAEPTIDIIPVEELGVALSFQRPFVAEKKIYKKGLADFQTEIDESAIYFYIYHNAKPKHHLEFGTWEGFGATLCARACDADIWTINLPEGESDADGSPLYGSTAVDDCGAGSLGHTLRGDSGDRIGWRYRAAGFASRVHQILCDSRDFDAEQFAPGFFDTILIDGGHKPDVVTNDTKKAIPLLRSGGIMIWHDFCPEVEALRHNEAPRGVVRAIIDNFAEWSRSFSRIGWIRPSWMLIGVKN